VKAKENNLIIHDSDLKRWAIRKSNELSPEKFTVSKMWLWRFKQQYRIVSRKITKFVTRNYSKERDDQISTANLFVNSSKLLVQDYTDCEIFNTDQSGFNKEIHSGRTLEFKGSRHVEATVQSISSTTHSYTIQPTISKSGRLCLL
jgi:hypothetical protein